ncbi:MAG: OadG family protein [Clostridia bacterium]|jgi:hypothetical protein|nr:OadG family protein [Clostridia bacterium]NLF37113.1 OadG family protein [Clostridiaceae bacterium]MDD3094610.1 OadG family protein [Clostridia bacterium]MDD3971612.1 OadG family protein [Clostridia bacterium]MDD4543608.1 OadG family protein [Clostridia bacterium]
MFNRFDLDNFLQTPRVVLLGMLGVFVALLVIYVSILLLNRVFRDKKKKD